MRVRNKPWAKKQIEDFPQYVVSEPAIWRGRWEERFGNNHPLHIEVGSGKGQFIYGMAKAHPEINYIAIEIQQSVLIDILDKQIAEPQANLQILHVDGGSVTDYFTPHEIAQVYLNFSDPWPKTRHAKRRLTYQTFLKGYEEILPPNGELHFKTDNRGLFEYSLASFSQYGMVLKKVWLDLHASDFEGNIMTEYEEKFSAKGQPIYRVEAYFPQKK